MTGRERILRAFKRETVDCAPVWFMRQAGRFLPQYRKLREKYSFLESCKNPELIFEITLLPVKILDVDAAIIFSDILLPVGEMGLKFDIVESKGPVFEEPFGDKILKIFHPFEPEEKMPYIGLAIKELRRELKNEKAILGFCGGPFTIASYIIEGGTSRDFLKTKKFIYEREKEWHILMEKLTQVLTKLLLYQLKSGADAVQLFDSWAGCLSPGDYRKYVMPYNSEIFKNVSFAINFSTGTGGFIEDVAECGGEIIGIDWRILIDKAWMRIGYQRGIQGNLDPAALLRDRASLYLEIRDILKRTGRRNGYIFNLGHGILPSTPLDNVIFTVEKVREIYQEEDDN